METPESAPPYKLAELKDCKGDLSKSWYIEYYIYSEIEGELVRKRERVPPKFKTDASRRKYAIKEIREINELLLDGYKLKKVENEQESGEKLLLTEALQNLVIVLRSELRPDTIDSYNSAINKLIGFEKPVYIDKITPQYVYKLRDFMLKSGGSAVSTNNIISHLRAMFSRIMVRENIKENPFKIKFLQVPQASHANIAFTDEDRDLVEKYLMKNDYELYVFTRFIYYAFLRPKELRNLKISSIRYQEDVLLVPGEVSKNKKTEQIPIIKPLKAIIEKNFLHAPVNCQIFGKGLGVNYGFASVNNAYDRHQRALDRIGLKDKTYTLYSWKHTGAVNAYLSGVGIKQLQLMLRHSTVQMTDIYLKSLGLRTDPNIENYNW